MKNVITVAACILNRCDSLSTMKLQKLLFYSQAYYLVKHNKPLFNEEFQAWANGPVVRELFEIHKGHFVVSVGFFGKEKISNLDKDAAQCVLHVINKLENYSGIELSNFTHSEDPWINVRQGCSPSDRCEKIITKESIKAYYSSSQALNNPVFAS